MTADADLLEQFLALDTATVSDALDVCGLPPGQGGLPPMWGRPRIAGFAATVELEPLNAEHAGAHILTDAIAKAGADNVMVVANGGRINVTEAKFWYQPFHTVPRWRNLFCNFFA